MENERVGYIDFMKVMGMFCIVLGHFFPGLGLSSFLYSFNVPIFFMISGYLCTKKYAYKVLISKLIPMIIILFSISIIRYPTVVDRFDGELNFLQYIIGILKGKFEYLGTFWFVYTLILNRIIHNFLLNRNRLQIVFSFMCILTLLILRNLYTIQDYPLASYAVLLTFPFFEFGYYINRKDLINYNYINKSTKILLIVLCFSLILIYVIGWFNGIPYIYNNYYGKSILLLTLTSFVGFFVCKLLAQKMSLISGPKVKKIVNIMSRANIIVLGFHGYLIVYFNLIFEGINGLYLCLFQIFASIMIMILFIPVDIAYCKYIEPILLKIKF